MIQALQNKIIIGILTIIAGSLIYLTADKVAENKRREAAEKQVQFEQTEGQRLEAEDAAQNRKIMEWGSRK